MPLPLLVDLHCKQVDDWEPVIRRLQLNSSTETYSFFQIEFCKSFSWRGNKSKIQLAERSDEAAVEVSYLSSALTVYEPKAGIHVESYQPAVYLYQPEQTGYHYGEV